MKDMFNLVRDSIEGTEFATVVGNIVLLSFASSTMIVGIGGIL